MRAAGYCRVSSQDQIDGTSLKSQEDQIRGYCTIKGIELAAVLVDAAVSGGKPLALRPEGSRLHEMLEAGEVQSVIITKLDRGFRSASDCLNNVEAWEKRKVSLHILNLGGQTIDTSTPTGKFFITVMAGAAELERNMINERCNEGREAKRQQGCRIGEIPFGYDIDPSDPNGKRLIGVPSEQDAIAMIRDLKSSGHSMRRIAAQLNDNGIATKKGGVWSHKQVSSIVERVA
jgi:site-specific DNA recombinase